MKFDKEFRLAHPHSELTIVNYASFLEKELDKKILLLKPIALLCPFCGSEDTQIIDSKSDCDCNNCCKSFEA